MILMGMGILGLLAGFALVFDGTDDLTVDKAIDMLVDDLGNKGIKLDVPAQPLHDPAFIGALNAAYDLGGPAIYPDEAPVSAFQFA